MPVDSFGRSHLGRALGVGLCLLSGGFAQAQGPAANAAPAAQAQGAFPTYLELAAQEPQRAGDPAFDAALGRAAHAAGEYPRAVMAWERVLAVQPGDLVAQMELGRALFAVGDRRAAWAVSGAVREQGIPVDAALDVDQFLVSYDRLEYSGASSIKGYAELAVGHDSNANAGPGSTDLNSPLPGTPAWTLAPGAEATSANFASALLAVRGRHVLDAGWSLVGAASGSARRHESRAQAMDQAHLDASAGVAWRRERHEAIVSGLVASQNLDGDRLRSMAGLQGEWVYRLDGFRQWGAFAQWLDVRYAQHAERNVHRSIAGVSYAQVLRNGALVYGSAYAGRESPQSVGAAAFGHHLTGFRVGGQFSLTGRLALFAALDGEHRRYGAVDPFFGVQRRDRQASVALGLSWVPAQDWRITPQWTLVRNHSSTPTTQYERRVLSLTVRREF